MNEDKMELEEAIKELKEKIEMLDRHIKNYEKSDCKTSVYLQLVKEKQAIETVFKALKEQDEEIVKYQLYLTEDVMPKKKIEDKIEELESTKFGNCANAIEVLQELLEDK